jgi:hypothetical protein
VLELEDFDDVAGLDLWAGGVGGLDEEDVGIVVLARRWDAGAGIDFVGGDEIEDRKVFDIENAVHAFEAEAALAVEEVGDVGLAEAGFLREGDAGEVTGVDTFGKKLAKTVLKMGKTEHLYNS